MQETLGRTRTQTTARSDENDYIWRECLRDVRECASLDPFFFSHSFFFALLRRLLPYTPYRLFSAQRE